MANLFSNEFASSFKQNSGIPAFEATDGPNRDIDSSKEDEEFSALSKPLPAFSNNETCKISDADIANQANIREYGSGYVINRKTLLYFLQNLPEIK